jgi:hypothetical protein
VGSNPTLVTILIALFILFFAIMLVTRNLAADKIIFWGSRWVVEGGMEEVGLSVGSPARTVARRSPIVPPVSMVSLKTE